MSKRILVIGDSYIKADVFTRALRAAGLGDDFDEATIAIADSPTWSAEGLREYEGDPAEVSELIDGHEIVLFHAAPITRQVLEENPSVKLLGCARGGPVNVDKSAAKDLGVRVTTTPGKNAEAVADLTIGFLINLLRNTMPAIRYVDHAIAHNQPVAESTFEGALWFGRELKGRKFGLVGLGHVARLVVIRAQALGLEVHAFDPYVSAGTVEGVQQAKSLDELLSRIEVLSMHARATTENRRMIGADQIALLPRGAYFINTARESLVDEAALLAAVRSGHLSGAALDVFEPNGPWRELIAEPSVILTPHIAGATLETLDRGVAMLVSEVQAYSQGDNLRWQL